jgi:catechol 2,3-dioxygenase-like lactoylglutathione lyase family enzyme
VNPRLDLIGIVVADMARSLAFYRRLGLDIPASADSEGHVEVALLGGLRLAWDTVEVMKSFDAEWTQPTGGSRFGLAFLVDSPADVDALYAELVASGATGHLEPWDAFWGQRYAVLKDPDGNDVSLFAPNA